MNPDNLPTEDLPYRGRTVLVVDDIAVNRMVAGELLQDLGATVLEAADGAIAVRMLRDEGQQVDLVLMDLQMPNMGGLEATKLLRSSGQAWLAQLPIMAMTGNVGPGDQQEALSQGMDGFITKPVSLQALIELASRAGT